MGIRQICLLTRLKNETEKNRCNDWIVGEIFGYSPFYKLLVSQLSIKITS